MTGPTQFTRFLDGLDGQCSFTCEQAELDRHLRDFTLPKAVEHRPLAVVYPHTPQDVSLVLRVAHEHRVPIVTQGGLTGMAGGALPSEACVVLSTDKLRGVEEIDTVADTVTVLAGTPLQAVQEAAGRVDRFFAVDFGARGSCTIGGAIATNAGGNRVLRFGMMRDQVLGLEVVLADGAIVTNLNKMIKNNAGYDLRHIFVGSEGTLGVITRAVLKLFPAPRSRNTMLCAVSGFENVLALLTLARGALGAQLAAFEVMWRDFYEVTHWVPGRAPLAPDAGTHFVLLETLGSNVEADEIVFDRFVEEAQRGALMSDAVLAQSLADAEDFWRIRNSSGELGRLWGKGPVVNFDVSVSVSCAEQFVDLCRHSIADALPGREAVFFGHIADSNMHLAVPDPEGTDRDVICDAVYATVRALGGSVSAEHGIGVDKRKYLHFSRSPGEIALMRRLKTMFDPFDILNPGKVLPAPTGSG